MSPDDRRAILELLKTLIGARGVDGLDLAGERTSGTRFLIPVHGICRHVEGYSDGWWSSLRPHTTAFGEGRRGDTRREVIWSDLVNARAVRAVSDQEEVDRTVLAARIRGALEERAVAAALEEAPVIASPEMARSLSGEATERDVFEMDRSAERGAGIFSCVDDFTTYFLNDGVRASVIARFTDVVRPLLAAGAELDIISHSFGTIVAYEGLRELADAGFTRPQVRNFFTVGAALAIGPARGRLRPGNRDGRKPAMVRRWVNLDAKGDPVGGRIQHRPFQVDAEYVELPNLGCGLLEFSCAHSSYFKPDNIRVNRDIFAAFINLAPR